MLIKVLMKTKIITYNLSECIYTIWSRHVHHIEVQDVTKLNKHYKEYWNIFIK